MGPLDIAIAGCGPGGLAAALLLKRDGHRVTVFERFETPRPIGSGLMLQPTGLAVLDRLGLADLALQKGARIDRLVGQAGMAGPVVLDVRYAALGRPAAFGIGIHRASLFALLHDAVTAAGVPIATGRTVASSVLDGVKRHLHFADGGVAGPFDLVVDALGTRTPLAPPTGRSLAYGAIWASLDWPDGASFDGAALEQRYRRASTMVGVLPIGTPSNASRPQVAFFWSLRADRLAAWRTAGLDAWKGEVLLLWPACAPLLDQIVDPDQLTFAHYAHRTLCNPAEPALIHIGDAWHSASPQLGQGANMALLDAWSLTKGLREGASVGAGLERAVAGRRRHVHLYQRLTALFTPVYQSDSRLLPFVRDRLVGPMSKLWPATWIQAAMVSGLIGNPLHPLGLDAPDLTLLP
ncbi:NAD(P)/FAD-dependent oxidoreductase [uncultured Sphingomonas sp.]|uniref:FAD-dependent oxidoreductase n=1 Tax=uncultured Sphingomonas sp. TaxID=158754 RepID=UPI002612FEC5|nr:NAD(P)/FAD-dependent oxidoreductase [uncultured Sphingomonas sp.]